MNTSTVSEETEVLARDVRFDNAGNMRMLLDDGREISVPVSWFPRHNKATSEQRMRWRFIGGGEGIHWEELDEDISVEGLLLGIRPLAASAEYISPGRRSRLRRVGGLLRLVVWELLGSRRRVSSQHKSYRAD